MAGNYIVTVSGLGTVCVAESYEVARESWLWYDKLAEEKGNRVYGALVQLIGPRGELFKPSRLNQEEDQDD